MGQLRARYLLRFMSDRLNLIRPDLEQLAAYKSHPGGASSQPLADSLDRLDTNESPLDLPDVLKQKLGDIYQQEIEANRYPDGSHLELKKAIAEYVIESAKLTWRVTPEHISVGNGSDELIRSLLLATCLGGRGSILVANPTFSMYGILAQTLGIEVNTIGRLKHDFSLDLEAGTLAVVDPPQAPVKVIFVVHPNSPTGNCLNEEEIHWLQSLPQDILVVVDEAYFEFSQKSLAEILPQHPNFLILRTFSKAFRLAAHRVGYGIGSPEIIAALEKVRLPYNLPTFSQTAALIALQNRDLLLPLVQETIDERAAMWEILQRDFSDRLDLWASEANFFYIRLKNSSDLALAGLASKLKTQGTLIRHTGRGLRITIGTKAENQRTLKRLQTILDGKSHQGGLR